MRSTAALLVLCSISMEQARSQQLIWSTEVEVDPPGMGHSRPRMALNAEGDAVVVWGKATPNANYAAVGGTAGFSAPIPLQPAGLEPPVADWQGTELGGHGDTLWAVFKVMPEHSMPMFGVRSNNGGFSWGDTLRIDGGHGAWSRFPAVAVGGDGEALVEYMAFDSTFIDPRHVVTRSVSGTFLPAVDVSAPFSSGEACDCCPGAITRRGPDVVALYRNNQSNIRTIWAASSNDSGSSFPIGAEVDPTAWLINACPSTGPDAFISGDSVFHVFMSGAEMGSKVYAAAAHLPDLTSGTVRRVTGALAPELENHPRIAGNGDTLGIVWQRAISGSADVLFSWSVTGLQGLYAPDTVHTDLTGQQRTPDIAFANGTFHIVWSDVSASQVRYRTATISGSSSTVEHPAPIALKAWPIPVSDRLRIDPGPFVPDHFELRDATGRLVLKVPGFVREIEVSDRAAGSYQLIAVDGRGSRGNAIHVVIVDEL